MHTKKPYSLVNRKIDDTLVMKYFGEVYQTGRLEGVGSNPTMTAKITIKTP